MTGQLRLTFLVLCLAFSLSNVYAQIRIEMNENSFLIMELGIVMEESDDAVVVRQKIPMPSPAEAEVDGPQLRVDDIIRFFNGKRLSSIVGLRELYDAVDPDEPIKLGVVRGSETLITSFKKVDMEALASRPGSGLRIQRRDPDGDAAGDVMPMPAIGAVVTRGPGGIEVDLVMGQGSDDQSLREGDILKKLNGIAIESIEQFNADLETIAVGDLIKLEISRDGNDLVIQFPKPDPASQPRMMIRSRSGDGG